MKTKNLIIASHNRGMITLDGKALTLEDSLKISNHSPTGFAWGYGGSGPAQTAFAILLKFLPIKEARALSRQFKWEHVANWPCTDLLGLEIDIPGWIEGKLGKDCPPIGEYLNRRDFDLIESEINPRTDNFEWTFSLKTDPPDSSRIFRKAYGEVFDDFEEDHQNRNGHFKPGPTYDSPPEFVPGEYMNRHEFLDQVFNRLEEFNYLDTLLERLILPELSYS